MTGKTSRIAGIAVLALGAGLGISASAIPASAATSAVQSVRVTPAITEGPCTHATWVHVNSSRGLECFAHPGGPDYFPGDTEIHTFCAGNNMGSFETYNVSTGKDTTWDFTYGYSHTFPSGVYIDWLTIQKGSGSDSC